MWQASLFCINIELLYVFTPPFVRNRKSESTFNNRLSKIIWCCFSCSSTTNLTIRNNYLEELLLCVTWRSLLTYLLFTVTITQLICINLLTPFYFAYFAFRLSRKVPLIMSQKTTNSVYWQIKKKTHLFKNIFLKNFLQKIKIHFLLYTYIFIK